MFLLTMWSAIIGTTSWSDYERRMIPFIIMRNALIEVDVMRSRKHGGGRSHTAFPALKRMSSSWHQPSQRPWHDQPAITMSLMEALMHCISSFHTGPVSPPMFHWAQKALSFLDFSIVVSFLLIGRVVKPWKSTQNWNDIGLVGRQLRHSYLSARSRMGDGPVSHRQCS